MDAGATDRTIAVVDIGSNSGRVVVYRRDPAGIPRVVAAARSPLRLVGEVDARQALGADATARTLEAMADFRAIARGAGASRVLAVATAAMRDARDGPALVSRIRETLGIDVEVIDGEREALLGLRGGISGLPVEDGLLFDLGGGSMQLTRFERRRLRSAWSFPLGSLRLSRAFLTSDPPTRGQVRRLRDHVRATLRAAGPPRLLRGEALVGTGGTIRNLAKVDRKRRDYPITRVHGYALSTKRVLDLADAIARRAEDRREEIPGVSGERGDSIAGGALAIAVLVEEVLAEEILVSGQGVREGLVLSLDGHDVPAVDAVREASLRSLTGRFTDWDEAAAHRRARLAEALLAALEPAAPEDIGGALGRAARLLDIGRSLDFFDRHEHAADTLLATDVVGFTHRELALTAAVMRAAADEEEEGRSLEPLLRRADRGRIERAGVLLALADDLQERCPPGVEPRVAVRRAGGAVEVAVDVLGGWRPRGLGARFERAFGSALVVRPGGFDTAAPGP